MARNLDPKRKVEIHTELKKLSSNHTMSESARILNISPSSVRHHGNILKLSFKQVQVWSRKKIIQNEDEFFNERLRENWLV